MHTVQLWHGRLTAHADEQLFALLDEQERARAARLRGEDDRAYFIQAHAMVRMILAAPMQCAPEAMRFSYGPHGKPSVAGSDMCFNASRSKDVAIVAVAPFALGIDVERITRTVNHRLLAEKVLTPAERAHIHGLPENEARRRFLTLWTRKEAFLKALGCGLSRAPHEVDALRSGSIGFAGATDAWHVQDLALRLEHATALVAPAACAVHAQEWRF